METEAGSKLVTLTSPQLSACLEHRTMRVPRRPRALGTYLPPERTPGHQAASEICVPMPEKSFLDTTSGPTTGRVSWMFQEERARISSQALPQTTLYLA
jgi:hypothetical protein